MSELLLGKVQAQRDRREQQASQRDEEQVHPHPRVEVTWDRAWVGHRH